MAELTNLESKLGEVVGLAMAATEATQKVMKLAREDGADELVGALQRMQQEAKETAERGEAVAGTFQGKKTAILEEARDVKSKAKEMMTTYLDQASDALDGFEFLTMAEAGETGHWRVVAELNARKRLPGLQEVVDWVTPIPERHFQKSLAGAVELAADEDPDATS